jgi:Mrp family chromosome partitioning ATPase
MALSRLLRILQARWWVVGAVAVVGFLGAGVFTVVGNRNPDSTYEAIAAIRFAPEEGQTIADLTDTIVEAETIARAAAGDLIQPPLVDMLADTANARLVIFARASSPDEARAKATEVRQAYFLVDPSAGGFVDDLLEEVSTDAVLIEAEIERLLAESQPVPELAAAHDLLSQQINSVTNRLVTLAVADASATAEQRQFNAAERTRLEQTLAQLRAEQAALEPLPIGTPIAERLQINALQRRLDLLVVQYERLFLRKLGVTALGTAEPIVVTDQTAEPASPLTNGFVGLLGGAAIALMALVFMDRARRPVWLSEDLPMPILGHVPSRRIESSGEVWYDESGTGPRKAMIQTLRSAVEAQLPPGQVPFSIAAHRVPSQALGALAMDLAASLANAGGSVLLVDIDFLDVPATGESEIPTMAEVLTLPAHGADFEVAVGGMLERLRPVRDGLTVIDAGPAPESPADALAGRQFRRFLDEVSKAFDFVVVVVGDATAPPAQAAMQRVGQAVLVLTPGASTQPEVDSLVIDLEQRQVGLMGAVFLERKEKLVGPFAPSTVTKTWAEDHRFDREEPPLLTVPPVAFQPMVGPTPRPTTPAVDFSQVRTRGLNDRIEEAEVALGEDVVAALAGPSPELGFEVVAEYVVARVEDMLSASEGSEGFSDNLVGEVVQHGIVPLRSFGGRPTVSDWLEREIDEDSDPATAAAVIDAMRRTLAAGSAGPVDLDDWLAGHFFERHLIRTDGEPYVWHLSSDRGTVQFLVRAERLDRRVIQVLHSETVPGMIKALEAALDEAEADEARSEMFERRLEEVLRFHKGLGALAGVGSAGRKRQQAGHVWAPDWSKGYRANLVGIQQSGLLPFKVLSEGEMAARTLTG